MITNNQVRLWRQRGWDDFCNGLSPLFRKDRDGFFFSVSDNSSGWSEEEEDEIGKAYMEGYQ